MKCLLCEKYTKNNKFCSRSCAATYNNRKNPKRKRRVKCKSCDQLILANRTYCSLCWGGKKTRTHKNCPDCGERLLLEMFHMINGKFPRPLRRCKECHRKWKNKRKLDFKKKCVKYKGGKCEICGYNKCLASLVFHHKNDYTKEFEIGTVWPVKNLTEKIIKELSKCQLLCSNCHGELHFS